MTLHYIGMDDNWHTVALGFTRVLSAKSEVFYFKLVARKLYLAWISA